MAPFLDSRWYTSTNVAALYAAAGGAPATTPAQDLVDTWASGGAGSDGFAMVFEDSGGTDAPSIYVKDSGTPANDTDINLTDDFSAFNAFLTYTSPSAKIVRQSDGDLKYCAQNRLTYSEQLDNAAWTKDGLSVTANAGTDPDGGSTADLLTENSATSNHRIYSGTVGVVGQYNQFSAYVKNNSGTRYVGLRIRVAGGYAHSVFDLATDTKDDSSDIYSSSITDVGDGWHLIKATAFVESNADVALLYFSNTATAPAGGATGVSYAGDGSSSMYVWGLAYRIAPADETYLPTTTAARYALPIQHDSSNNAEGLLVEPAATNLVTYSNDLTNAAWTKANMTTAKTATGPGGSSNEATTCTATAGNATALFSITSASAARVTSAYIKRRTGTGNIDLTQNNGSTWTTVAVDSNWTRFDIGPATAANPIVGIRIVTSGDAVDVALFQHEVGSVPTSPIITTGATATRAVDYIEEAASALPYDASSISIYGKVTPKGPVESYPFVVSLFNSLNERVTMTAAHNTHFLVKDGGTNVVNFDLGTFTINTSGKVAGAVEVDDAAATIDGATVSTDTDTGGGMPDAATAFQIGGSNASVTTSVLIHEFMYLPERMSNTDLESITT